MFEILSLIRFFLFIFRKYFLSLIKETVFKSVQHTEDQETVIL